MHKQLSVIAASLLLAATACASPKQFEGVWQVIGNVAALRTTSGAEPPLLPEAKAVYDKHRASRKAGDTSYDPTRQCLPHGVPRIAYEPMPFELLPQAKQVVFMYQWNRLVRLVDLNKEHTEPPGPTFLGQSVGHWDGDTLVVDTNSFNDMSLLDADGMPHSDQLHVIERYTLDTSGNKMDAVITVEDPQTFSRPWETRVSFKRLHNVRIEEDVCVERLGLEQYK